VDVGRSNLLPLGLKRGQDENTGGGNLDPTPESSQGSLKAGNKLN